MAGKNEYGLDDKKNDILWSSAGQQVMMAWEKDYMEHCVDVLQITSACDVLEIGFGLGYSADRIQSENPNSHTIIECDPVCLVRLEQWAATRKNVRIVAGTWQTKLASLGEFDCIFFDDYPLPQMERDESIFSISRWHDFLDTTLNWHTKIGGRVTGYLAREIDLCREGCEVSLIPFEVDVPDNCVYFPYGTALIPLVRRIHPVQSITTYSLHRHTSELEQKKLSTHPRLIELRRRLELQKSSESGGNLEPSIENSTASLDRKEYIQQLKESRDRKRKQIHRE